MFFYHKEGHLIRNYLSKKTKISQPSFTSTSLSPPSHDSPTSDISSIPYVQPLPTPSSTTHHSYFGKTSTTPPKPYKDYVMTHGWMLIKKIK